MSQGKGFMQQLTESDPEFLGLLKPLWDEVMKGGALDQKTKTLMVLFFDATQGHKEAVKALAAGARKLGATEEEIKETVRMAFLTSGVTGISAGMTAFEE